MHLSAKKKVLYIYKQHRFCTNGKGGIWSLLPSSTRGFLVWLHSKKDSSQHCVRHFSPAVIVTVFSLNGQLLTELGYHSLVKERGAPHKFAQ